jgi:hypothetical protein
MNKKINILLGIIMICTLSSFTNAQDVTGVVIANSTPVVKGAPYSADSISETVQTLADGNKITSSSKLKLYRDGEGRTRREEILAPNNNSGSFINLRETITITDPTTGFNYYLNPIAKTARRLAIAPKIPITTGQTSPTLAGYTSTGESLGIKNIEGVECTGRGSKTVIAAGTVGNERELVMTNEIWFSTELKVIILSKSVDLRFGDRTSQLSNIKREEPDKSLFSIPADYKITN